MVAASNVRGSVGSHRYAFARHETFHLRDGWLFKGLEAIQQNSLALSEKEAHHSLGIGVNMLRALIYWIQATNLAEPASGQSRPRPLRLTEVGELVRSHDLYLEDIGTLWLLQIELASNQALASFWYWVFNQFPQREFNEDRLIQEVQQFLSEQGAASISPQSLKKDVRCFLRTYLSSTRSERGVTYEDALDCPLSGLGILRAGAMPGRYRFHVGSHRSLPLLIFAYALFRFREQTGPEEVVLALEDLRWAPLSPGRLLCLDSATILEYIEELQHRTPYASLIRSAGLNMVALERDRKAVELLQAYYSNVGGSHD